VWANLFQYDAALVNRRRYGRRRSHLYLGWFKPTILIIALRQNQPNHCSHRDQKCSCASKILHTFLRHNGFRCGSLSLEAMQCRLRNSDRYEHRAGLDIVVTLEACLVVAHHIMLRIELRCLTVSLRLARARIAIG
jgi:hypothetical protein